MFEGIGDFFFLLCLFQDQSCNMLHYIRREKLEVPRIAMYSYYTYLNRLLLEFSNYR
jgi:hypothetical protein